jgi:hypothetical protein
MRPYISRNKKDSGVIGYESGNDNIIVLFTNGDQHTYTHVSAGRAVVEQMKKLAQEHNGLSAFISQKKPQCASKKKLVPRQHKAEVPY